MRSPTWIALAFVVCGVARAGEPTPSEVVSAAVRQMEFGDFEGVVAALQPIAEDGGRALPSRQDRIEALRAYGIACAALHRRNAAEGAFMLLLTEKPNERLDPRLVRPEAVELLREVRLRFPPTPRPRPPGPLSRQVRIGAALITFGAVMGVTGVATGVGALYTQGIGAHDWETIVPVSLLAASLLPTAFGIALVARDDAR